MTLYLFWSLGGLIFSLATHRLLDDVTLAKILMLLFACLVFGPLPGLIYLFIWAAEHPEPHEL